MTLDDIGRYLSRIRPGERTAVYETRPGDLVCIARRLDRYEFDTLLTVYRPVGVFVQVFDDADDWNDTIQMRLEFLSERIEALERKHGIRPPYLASGRQLDRLAIGLRGFEPWG